jgi:hypothetical protein
MPALSSLRSTFRLPVYRVADAFDRIANAAFNFSPCFLAFACCTVGFAFGLELTVTRYFAGFVLDPAFSLFPFAVDFVFIRI